MTIQHMRIACWIPYATKHTLRICNTYCFSTATSFPIKQLNVTLYVHCSLSGSDLYVLPEKRVEFIAVCSQYFIWIVLVSSFYLYRPCFLTAGPRPGTGPWHYYTGLREVLLEFVIFHE